MTDDAEDDPVTAGRIGRARHRTRSAARCYTQTAFQFQRLQSALEVDMATLIEVLTTNCPRH